MPTVPLIIKGESEIVFPTYDITVYMRYGDTISGLLSSIKVLQGLDPYPESMLYTDPTATNNVVKQPIFFGIPGVTYEITTHVSTDLGDLIDVVWMVSVMPSASVEVPSRNFYSLLYPFTHTESLSSTSSLSKISSLEILNDSMNVSVSLGLVDLQDAVKYLTYSFTESINSTASLNSINLIKTVDYETYQFDESLNSTAWVSIVTLIVTTGYVTTTLSDNLTSSVSLSGVVLT